MCKKWKSVSAVGLAALLVCLVPAGTMMAAEENAEKVQTAAWDSVSGNDDKMISDNWDSSDEADADEAESVNDESDADSDESDDNASHYEVEKAPAARGVEALAAADAPVIKIEWWGDEPAYSLGGKIDYKYVKYQGYSIECSVDAQDGQTVSLSYCLDRVTDTVAEAKGESQMDSLTWGAFQESIMILNDGNYVLYMKAEADGQTAYARSGGIVVDTKAPVISGVEEGQTYPEGTTFQVEDANLESVKINERTVTPTSDGSYLLSADGTSASCVIRALDKAGNEKICSITVSGKEPGEGVISVNGTYSLKAGVSYQLAGGKWQVNGDGTVYRGGSTFYVKTDGDYRFTKQ